MPTINVQGAELHYVDEGEGPQTILFCHGLIWDHRLFAPQIAFLKSRYRCVAFDFRGQGQSQVTENGYDMDSLTNDAIAIIDRLSLAPCHIVGLSMGGFVAMRIAARKPSLVRSIVLMNTSADPEPARSAAKYRLLNFVARWFGLRCVADRVMPVMFGKTFLNDEKQDHYRQELKARLISNHPKGIVRAVNGVINRLGVMDELNLVTAPTLILSGSEDVATIPEKSRRIHEAIKHSDWVTISGAGHTSALEAADAVNQSLANFLDKVDDQNSA